MTPASFSRQLQLGEADAVECLILAQNGWSNLQSALPETLSVVGLWQPAAPGAAQAALALQLLTGGPCLTLLPAETQQNVRHSPQLADLHAQCLKSGMAVAVMVAHGEAVPWELMLVPVKAMEGSQAVPAFWGFSVGNMAAIMASELLSRSRLPVVFDLDETLLVAYSVHSLENRLDALMEQRRKARDAAAAEHDAEQRAVLVAEHGALDKECTGLAQDLELLRQYADADAIVVDGVVMKASDEEVLIDGKRPAFTRPVIRLPERGAVLTRISPDRRETSMIMRPRPGWEDLRAYLLEGLPTRQRYEVYVCTAAEREYALEAWRILDPTAQLLPHAQRAQRVACVPARRKKSLSEVLCIGEALAGGEGTSPKPGPMPLAVIVDDRLDVWEDGSQAQVLRVQPFSPHKVPFTSQAVLSEADMLRALCEEMVRVQSVLHLLRANAYFTINEEMRAPIERLATGMEVSMQVCCEQPHMLLPSPPRIAALLPQKLTMPEVRPRPAISLQPVDPRHMKQNRAGSPSDSVPPAVAQNGWPGPQGPQGLRAVEGTVRRQNSAGAGASAVQAPAATGLLPQDPRKAHAQPAAKAPAAAAAAPVQDPRIRAKRQAAVQQPASGSQPSSQPLAAPPGLSAWPQPASDASQVPGLSDPRKRPRLDPSGGSGQSQQHSGLNSSTPPATSTWGASFASARPVANGPPPAQPPASAPAQPPTSAGPAAGASQHQASTGDNKAPAMQDRRQLSAARKASRPPRQPVTSGSFLQQGPDRDPWGPPAHELEFVHQTAKAAAAAAGPLDHQGSDSSNAPPVVQGRRSHMPQRTDSNAILPAEAAETGKAGFGSQGSIRPRGELNYVPARPSYGPPLSPLEEAASIWPDGPGPVVYLQPKQPEFAPRNSSSSSGAAPTWPFTAQPQPNQAPPGLDPTSAQLPPSGMHTGAGPDPDGDRRHRHHGQPLAHNSSFALGLDPHAAGTAAPISASTHQEAARLRNQQHQQQQQAPMSFLLQNPQQLAAPWAGPQGAPQPAMSAPQMTLPQPSPSHAGQHEQRQQPGLSSHQQQWQRLQGKLAAMAAELSAGQQHSMSSMAQQTGPVSMPLGRQPLQPAVQLTPQQQHQQAQQAQQQPRKPSMLAGGALHNGYADVPQNGPMNGFEARHQTFAGAMQQSGLSQHNGVQTGQPDVQQLAAQHAQRLIMLRQQRELQQRSAKPQHAQQQQQRPMPGFAAVGGYFAAQGYRQ